MATKTATTQAKPKFQFAPIPRNAPKRVGAMLRVLRASLNRAEFKFLLPDTDDGDEANFFSANDVEDPEVGYILKDGYRTDESWEHDFMESDESLLFDIQGKIRKVNLVRVNGSVYLASDITKAQRNPVFKFHVGENGIGGWNSFILTRAGHLRVGCQDHTLAVWERGADGVAENALLANFDYNHDDALQFLRLAIADLRVVVANAFKAKRRVAKKASKKSRKRSR